MKKSCWRTLTNALLLASTAVVLSSCRFVTKNISFMADTMSKAKPDDVVVERGNGGSAAVPATPPFIAPPASTASHYTVQYGDTLSSIARKNGVSLATLCSANGIAKDSTLRSGQKLRIPHATSHAAAAVSNRTTEGAATANKTVTPHMTSYKVKTGETLSGIARRHNTTVSAILKANGLKADQADRIRDGEMLKIPAGK